MAVDGPDLTHRDPESNIEGGRANTLLANSRCSCCYFPCLGSRRPSSVGSAWWERIRATHIIRINDHWWAPGVRALKKIREWSELVAGPRWKTFIRRFNRNRSSCSGGKHGKFQYDPLSYSLNFDGPGGNLDEDDDNYSALRNFSARYASVPAPLKSPSSGSGKLVAVFE